MASAFRWRAATCWTTAANGRFSFEVGTYQRDHELIIDPGVQYTTFLGGTSAETPVGIAVDSAGNAYVAGTTQSPNFPTTTGAFDRTGAAQNFADVFVTKLNPAGTALVYSTFVGGSNMEFGQDMALDGSGNVYVTGQTKSSNFPTTGGAFDRTLNIPANCPRCAVDNTDNFVFKLNAAGSALAYSTYLGGTDYDAARGIAVDGSGNAYVAGETLSADFPTTAGAFDRTRGGEYDMFVTKLNTTGSALVYSTFIGGAACRQRRATDRRQRRQRVCAGLDELDRLPDDRRRVRHHRQRLRLRRNTDEAEPGRLGADLLHAASMAVPVWLSTVEATPTWPAVRRRQTSRRRPARTTRRSTTAMPS